MSTAVSRGQALQVAARVGTQVNWDELDGKCLQEVINLGSEEFSRRFTAFLKNGARLIVGEPKVLTLDPTKVFNHAEFIGQGWSVWKGPADGNGLKGPEDRDERSQTLTEVDWSRARFEICLKDGETSIKGEEKLQRLKKAPENLIRLGGNVFLALWRDYQANKENSILEWIHRTCQITYLDFFGDILRDPGSRRHVLCLFRGGGGWYWCAYWLGDDWDARDRSAGLDK